VIAIVAGRSPKDGAIVLVATWLAFCLALALALPQPPNPAHVALGALLGSLLILAGFFTASRLRDLPLRSPAQGARLAAWSLLVGTLLGAVLLAFLIAFAGAEPALRARFAGRLSEPAWRPWALGFESSILEEVTFRLFAMSVVAWLTMRFLRRSGAAFAMALITSSLLFGLAHIPAWTAVAHPAPVLISGVLLLNGLGGLLFGWLFWRWGLPYAILCHFAGDVVIQALGPRLLA
jgi:membrane protease YdiL (CAAX protease family)